MCCDRTRIATENELQQKAERLHALGPLPLFHFVSEILSGSDITETLNKYTALDPDVVRKLGADSVEAESTANETELAYVDHILSKIDDTES
jgi:hypothetical protein